jgi:20S proteasome alpha/beta subunit
VICSRFDPYSDNGGTILAIAGADFSVIAGDTRQSEGYSIQTRYARKVWQLWVVHLAGWIILLRASPAGLWGSVDW